MTPTEMSNLIPKLLPLLIPIAIIQLGLMIAALVDLLKRKDRYSQNMFIVWLLVVILVNLIGPILYFVIGRREE